MRNNKWVRGLTHSNWGLRLSWANPSLTSMIFSLTLLPQNGRGSRPVLDFVSLPDTLLNSSSNIRLPNPVAVEVLAQTQQKLVITHRGDGTLWDCSGSRESHASQHLWGNALEEAVTDFQPNFAYSSVRAFGNHCFEQTSLFHASQKQWGNSPPAVVDQRPLWGPPGLDLPSLLLEVLPGYMDVGKTCSTAISSVSVEKKCFYGKKINFTEVRLEKMQVTEHFGRLGLWHFENSAFCLICIGPRWCGWCFPVSSQFRDLVEICQLFKL